VKLAAVVGLLLSRRLWPLRPPPSIRRTQLRSAVFVWILALVLIKSPHGTLTHRPYGAKRLYMVAAEATQIGSILKSNASDNAADLEAKV